MRLLRRKWLQIFVSGLFFLYVIEKIFVSTHNLHFVPSIIFLGSFLIPVTFVVYLYEILPNWEVTLAPMAICFLWGGVIGTAISGVLEYEVLKSLGFLPMLAVGLIEESAKLLFPLRFYLKGRYRSEASGILIGTACAMGFAALETMGYSFVTLLRSKGNLVVLDEVLFARGLLSPAGHAAWTGLVCAVLWREREKAGLSVMNWKVIGVFIMAVMLHTSWDLLNKIRGGTYIEFLNIEILSALVAIASLSLLHKRVLEARSSYPFRRVV